MCIVCWITKATDRHSALCNNVVPLQQWLHERAPILRDTYIAFLLISLIGKISVKVYKYAYMKFANPLSLYCLFVYLPYHVTDVEILENPANNFSYHNLRTEEITTDMPNTIESVSQ